MDLTRKADSNEDLAILVRLFAEMNERRADRLAGRILLHPTARMAITKRETRPSSDRALARALALLDASTTPCSDGAWDVVIPNWLKYQGFTPTEPQQIPNETPAPTPTPTHNIKTTPYPHGGKDRNPPVGTETRDHTPPAQVNPDAWHRIVEAAVALWPRLAISGLPRKYVPEITPHLRNGSSPQPVIDCLREAHRQGKGFAFAMFLLRDGYAPAPSADDELERLREENRRTRERLERIAARDKCET